jgi:hypothetical protein
VFNARHANLRNRTTTSRTLTLHCSSKSKYRLIARSVASHGALASDRQIPLNFCAFSDSPSLVDGLDLRTENIIHCPLNIGSSAGNQPPSIHLAIGIINGVFYKTRNRTRAFNCAITAERNRSQGVELPRSASLRLITVEREPLLL